MSDAPSPDELTTKEAAALLGVTAAHVRSLIRLGRLSVVGRREGQMGRPSYLLSRSDLEAHRERCKTCVRP